MNVSGELSGVCVMVTRPTHQARPLCALIEGAGGRALPVSAIDIRDSADPAAALAALARLADYDFVIFVSVNAVEYARALMEKHGVPVAMPPCVAAVGQRTAEALAAWLKCPVLHGAAPYNSEALLAQPALQEVAGRRILIMRGEGGRELLADTLRARGAHVEYAEVYRRELPPDGLAVLDDAQTREQIGVIVVTSGNGLANLMEMADAPLAAWLRAKPLVVISARIVAAARALGFNGPVVVAPEASDAGLYSGLLQWRKAKELP